MSAPESKQNENTEELQLALNIFDLLEEKKAGDLLLLDLRTANPYFSYFLLASAQSLPHLKALVRDIERDFGSSLPGGLSTSRREDAESGWTVIDFIEVVVHIFQPEQRSFYNLERLWGDAKVIRRSESVDAS